MSLFRVFVLLVLILCALAVTLSTFQPNRDGQYRMSEENYFLVTLTIAKSEEMVIEEFIEHYRSEGVGHMYIIDNSPEPENEMAKKIQPYVDDGFVTVFHRSKQYSQKKHYREIYRKFRTTSKWWAVVDVDEYIFGVKKPLVECLVDLKGVHYIQVHWTMYGWAGIETQPESIRESFLLRAESTHFWSKGLFLAEHVKNLGIHVHKKISKTNVLKITDVQHPVIRLNHYFCMSKEYFQKVKMTRGDATTSRAVRDDGYFSSMNESANLVRDTTLAEIVKEGKRVKSEGMF